MRCTPIQSYFELIPHFPSSSTNDRNTEVTGDAYSSPLECCQTRFWNRPCNVIDACFVSQSPTPSPSHRPTEGPTTHVPTYDPTTAMPTELPVTQAPVMLANDGSIIDPSCYDKDWHVSRVPGVENTCTNDLRYPPAWMHPAMKEYFLFGDARECCETNFGTPTCTVHDVCVTGTDPPTEMPTTPFPTMEPWPTYSPTVKPLYATAETTCNWRWHATTHSQHAENTCTNDREYPNSWNDPSRRKFFLFENAAGCCEALFSNYEDCYLVNVCPEGGPTHNPTESPTVPYPSASPEREPSPPPTRRPSPRPSPNARWFIDRSTSKCVQSCTGKPPCGGKLAAEWEQTYHSAGQCCAEMSWISREQCEITPMPTMPPEPTESPSMKPTGKPTEKPTTVRVVFACSCYLVFSLLYSNDGVHLVFCSDQQMPLQLDLQQR